MVPYVAHVLSWFYHRQCDWMSFQWGDNFYRNRLGAAGGLDKNARMINPLFRLGFGFVEIGTVTPEPQGPNPGKILDRDWSQKALWNKMGFPNKGSRYVLKKLKNLKERLGPIWVNIGKNRDTKLEDAHRDYEKVTSLLHPYADVLVINISSPNTANLRELQRSRYLRDLLKPVRAITSKPILLKLSPDQSETDLEYAMGEALNQEVDGFILTNTTLSRTLTPHWPKDGGVSGYPLASLSIAALKVATKIKQKSGCHFLIVSVGGVMTPQDVRLRLDMGADLVQVYSALVFEGFSFAQSVSDYFHASNAQKI
jgi:dihydroorotate dehydrogenase